MTSVRFLFMTVGCLALMGCGTTSRAWERSAAPYLDAAYMDWRLGPDDPQMRLYLMTYLLGKDQDQLLSLHNDTLQLLTRQSNDGAQRYEDLILDFVLARQFNLFLQPATAGKMLEKFLQHLSALTNDRPPDAIGCWLTLLAKQESESHTDMDRLLDIIDARWEAGLLSHNFLVGLIRPSTVCLRTRYKDRLIGLIERSFAKLHAEDWQAATDVYAFHYQRYQERLARWW